MLAGLLGPIMQIRHGTIASPLRQRMTAVPSSAGQHSECYRSQVYSYLQFDLMCPLVSLNLSYSLLLCLLQAIHRSTFRAFRSEKPQWSPEYSRSPIISPVR